MIPGPFAYSPSTHIPTLLSSSFLSDIGTPTSSILVDMSMTSSSQAPPLALLVPNLKAGKGVLKLLLTKQRAWHKPAITCLFCHEWKIACGAPPVGSADTTCKWVVAPSISDQWIGLQTPVAVSVHGAHSSVNTPQCCSVDSISIETMGAATTRNLKMQITCLICSY